MSTSVSSVQAPRRSNLNTGLPRYARNDKQNGLLYGVYNEHFGFLSTGSANVFAMTTSLGEGGLLYDTRLYRSNCNTI